MNEIAATLDTTALIQQHQLTVVPLPRNQGFVVGVFGEVWDINTPGFLEVYEGNVWTCEGHLHQVVTGRDLTNAVRDWVRRYGN